MPGRFDDWLAQTRELQREVYSVNVDALPLDERLDYIRLNVLCAHTELSEAIQCLPWKTWRINQGMNTRSAALELVDVLHFVANVLVALGVNDEELRKLYDIKNEMNIERRRLTA